MGLIVMLIRGTNLHPSSRYLGTKPASSRVDNALTANKRLGYVTCVARSSECSLWQAVVLINGVPKVTHLEDWVLVWGLKQDVLQLDVPVDNTHSACVKLCYLLGLTLLKTVF